MDEQGYIKDRLDDQIQWYSTKSQWNQKCYKRFRILEILAACLIPLIVGYVIDTRPFLKVIVGILGVLVALVSGILSLYKFQENWIEYRTVAESLKHEKYLFLTKSEPYNIDNSFSLLVERVEGMISVENSKWSQYIKAPEKKENVVE